MHIPRNDRLIVRSLFAFFFSSVFWSVKIQKKACAFVSFYFARNMFFSSLFAEMENQFEKHFELEKKLWEKNVCFLALVTHEFNIFQLFLF